MTPNWLELVTAILGLALIVWGARMDTRKPYWADELNEAARGSVLEQVLDNRRK